MEQKKSKKGRKKIEFDYNKIRQMFLAQCSVEEVAKALNCSVKTLYANKKVREIMKTARTEGLMMIKLKQYEKGVIDGDREMLKHLGKIYLNQNDSVTVQGNLNIKIKWE